MFGWICPGHNYIIGSSPEAASESLAACTAVWTVSCLQPFNCTEKINLPSDL